MLVAIAMVKDEADILGWTLDHLHDQGVDHCIIADNLSTDATRHILEGYGDWITIVDDDEYGYYQSIKMTRLAAAAHTAGATWVLPFDADELIVGPTRLADWFAGLPADVGIVSITGYDFVPAAIPWYVNPWTACAWRRAAPQSLPKVAFRAHPGALIHMGNHDVAGIPGRRIDGLTLRHLQYRSYDQLVRKLRNGRAVYAATDLHPGHGTHWRAGGAKTDDELAAMWHELCAGREVYDPWPA